MRSARANAGTTHDPRMAAIREAHVRREAARVEREHVDRTGLSESEREIIRSAEAAVDAGSRTRAARERVVHRWECGRCAERMETPKAPAIAPDGKSYCARCAEAIRPYAATKAQLASLKEDDREWRPRPLPKAEDVPEVFRFEQRRAAEQGARKDVRSDTPAPPKGVRSDTPPSVRPIAIKDEDDLEEAAPCDEESRAPSSTPTAPTRSPSTTSPSTTATASRSSPASRRSPEPGGSSMSPPAPSSTLNPTTSSSPSSAPSSVLAATPGGDSTPSGAGGAAAVADACPKKCGKTTADFETLRKFRGHVASCGSKPKGKCPFTPEQIAKAADGRRRAFAERKAEREAAKEAAKSAPPAPDSPLAPEPPAPIQATVSVPRGEGKPSKRVTLELDPPAAPPPRPLWPGGHAKESGDYGPPVALASVKWAAVSIHLPGGVVASLATVDDAARFVLALQAGGAPQ